MNRERLYDLGLLTITKSAMISKGKKRELHLGLLPARKGGAEVAKVEVRAIGGAPHTAVIVAGTKDYVMLTRVQTRRSVNKLGRKRNHRRFRFYNVYRIPDDPRVPLRLRGAEITIRLDDPDYATAPVRRAENVHTIAPGEPDWERLFDLRNPTESINNWIKERLQGKKRWATTTGGYATSALRPPGCRPLQQLRRPGRPSRPAETPRRVSGSSTLRATT